ncbi:HNH/ENDO VII family nuclease, partial [Heyndrickxia sporothermodurans]
FGDGTKGTGKETYQHLKDYKNNKYFTRSVEYNAGKDGTGFTYKVYQRGDINWDMVRTKGAKKGRGLTNAEASAKYGLAPILDEAGSVATLHHSQQKGVGPLYEASTRYHNIANAKRAPLHPYKGKLNPFYPMDETTRGAFQKVDSINYWKIRGEEALGGR